MNTNIYVRLPNGFLAKYINKELFGELTRVPLKQCDLHVLN